MGRRNPFVTSSQILKGSKFQSHAVLNVVLGACAAAKETVFLVSLVLVGRSRRNPCVTSSQILKGSRFQSHAALNAVIRTCATAKESALLKSNHSLVGRSRRNPCV